MINDLEFFYSSRVLKNTAVEVVIKNNIGIWLKPIEQEINDNHINVGVVFLSQDKNHITLLGADADLYARFIDLLKMYIPPED